MVVLAEYINDYGVSVLCLELIKSLINKHQRDAVEVLAEVCLPAECVSC